MLLLCPNCEAKYDVPEDAIAPEGRDVECSNCGHGWFQASGGAMADEKDDGLAFVSPAIEDEASDDDAEAALMAALNMDDDETPNPLAPPARKIDQSVLDVLREEANREAQARAREKRERVPKRGAQAEPASPEFGLPEDFVMPNAAGEGAQNSPKPTARRDLLPDVEEINSTLLADEALGLCEEQQQAPKSSKPLRNGFVFGFILALLAGGTYLKADEIAAQVPALAPYLSAFGTWVDGLSASR